MISLTQGLNEQGGQVAHGLNPFIGVPVVVPPVIEIVEGGSLDPAVLTAVGEALADCSRIGETGPLAAAGSAEATARALGAALSALAAGGGVAAAVSRSGASGGVLGARGGASSGGARSGVGGQPGSKTGTAGSPAPGRGTGDGPKGGTGPVD